LFIINIDDQFKFYTGLMDSTMHSASVQEMRTHYQLQGLFYRVDGSDVEFSQ